MGGWEGVRALIGSSGFHLHRSLLPSRQQSGVEGSGQKVQHDRLTASASPLVFWVCLFFKTACFGFSSHQRRQENKTSGGEREREWGGGAVLSFAGCFSN